MMRKKRRDNLARIVWEYADSRSLEFLPFSGIHYRLSDAGFMTVDIWPTPGKYWVKDCDYSGMGLNIIERGGETGELPFGKDKIYEYLDRLMYGKA